MSKFTVRVELRNATEDEYEKLRVEMEERGFSRLLPAGDGGKYLLPTGERVAQSLCLSNSAALIMINIH